MGSREARPAEHDRQVAPGRLYEQIGVGYTRHRRPDPRIVARLDDALGAARRILNVGAGAGSYEPTGRQVVAVEPSPVMLAQRPRTAAPVVRGVAEALPFPDERFDVALAVLTLQHWTDPIAGLRELRRVARRQVVLHYEPGFEYWLTSEYLPQLRELDVGHVLTVADVVAALGGAAVTTIKVPHDCVDGFFAAYWRRPAAYLERSVRDAISMFARIPDEDVQPGLRRLDRDLASGSWRDGHADLLELDELDAGYRLIVAG
jgi:SAM-dependent methyltransferase